MLPWIRISPEIPVWLKYFQLKLLPEKLTLLYLHLYVDSCITPFRLKKIEKLQYFGVQSASHENHKNIQQGLHGLKYSHKQELFRWDNMPYLTEYKFYIHKQ